MAAPESKTIWLHFRLQALNLPIMGGKATLISCLNLATGTKQLCSTSNSQAGRARAKHLAPKSRPVRATLTAAAAESSTEQANLENPGDDSSNVASGGNLDEIMEEFSSDDSPILSKLDLSPPLNWLPYRTPSGPHSIKRFIPLVFRARPTAWHFQHSTSQARISFSCGSQSSTGAEFTR